MTSLEAELRERANKRLQEITALYEKTLYELDQAELCDFYGHPMHECDCRDGMHRQNIPLGAEPVGV